MKSRFANAFIAVFMAAILAGILSCASGEPTDAPQTKITVTVEAPSQEATEVVPTATHTTVPPTSTPVPTPTPTVTIPGAGVDPGEEVGIIETEFGNIVIELFSEVAPTNVKNFKDLAESGFYNGTTFHRVIQFFMIQGGDPLSKDDDKKNDGSGGPGYTVKGEFSQIPHERGIVSMARRGDEPESGSQFFIMVKYSDRAKKNDGKFTVIGRVIEGMDVVDEISAVPRDFRDNPNSPIPMNVRIETR